MPVKLKPCRNCGGENLHHYTASPAREVECDDCHECKTEEDWQSSPPVENSLRVENAGLRIKLEAAEQLIAALEREIRVCSEFAEFANALSKHEYFILKAIARTREARANWQSCVEMTKEQTAPDRTLRIE